MRTSPSPTRTFLAAFLLAAGPAFAGAVEIEPGLPPNATAIVTVNVKQLLHTPVVKQHGLRGLKQLCKDTALIQRALEALGFDPFRDLERLSLAVISQDKKEAFVLIVRGHFDTARFRTLGRHLAREWSDQLKLHKEDGRTFYSIVSSGEHGSVVFSAEKQERTCTFGVGGKGSLLDLFGGTCVTLASKDTLIAASSPELLKETCDRVGGKDSPARQPLRRLLADLDGKQTVVFAVQPAPTVAERTVDWWETDGSEAQEDPKPADWLRDLCGGITLAEDFTLRCTLRASSSRDAREAMTGLADLRLRMDGLATFLAGSSKEYAFLKEVPRSFLAVRKKDVILVEGHLSAETLGKLLGDPAKSERKNVPASKIPDPPPLPEVGKIDRKGIPAAKIADLPPIPVDDSGLLFPVLKCSKKQK